MSERAVFPRSMVDEVFAWLWSVMEREYPKLDLAPLPEVPFEPGRSALASRLCAVGGYRRGKTEMKDLELLIEPRMGTMADASDLFGAPKDVNVTLALCDALVKRGDLEIRLKSTGAVSSWGESIRHARHVATGLPIDLFFCPAEFWANRMVVTTGPRELNVRIAEKALAAGYEWEVAAGGFVPRGQPWATCPQEFRKAVRSEAEVFEFVKLPFLRPEDRR